MGKPDAYLYALRFNGVLSDKMVSMENLLHPYGIGVGASASVTTVPLYAIDDETRAALLAGIQALRQAGGYTVTIESAEKHIAILERLREQ